VCRRKHVEQLRNNGIINSTTQSHLVGSFYEIYVTMHGFMNMKFIKEGFYVILLFSLFDTRSHISYCFSIKSSFYSCLIELRISYCEHKMMLGMKAKNCVSCVLSD